MSDLCSISADHLFSLGSDTYWRATMTLWISWIQYTVTMVKGIRSFWKRTRESFGSAPESKGTWTPTYLRDSEPINCLKSGNLFRIFYLFIYFFKFEYQRSNSRPRTCQSETYASELNPWLWKFI